ncbi:MAG: ABC transporter ATP-binding protein [Microcella sp.]
MTDKTPRRERLRPGELVGLAAVVAAFIGLVTFMVTRDWLLALIFFGGTFVIDLIVLAMLMLAVTPNKPADGERWAVGEQQHD